MPDNPIFTLQFDRGIRTNSDTVSGTVVLNVSRAVEKQVEKVRISLRAEIHTEVNAPRNQGESRTETFRQRIRLFNFEMILWNVASHAGSYAGIINLPYSFMLPADPQLPPSFEGKWNSTSGAVKYYIHIVAERRGWFQRNTRVNEAFPFLPHDYTPAPYLILPNWPGEWKTSRVNHPVRKGILNIGKHGSVEVEFNLPDIPSIPLFRPIPIQLRIICSSKPLPASAARDLSKFEFPRNPALTDVDLNLSVACRARAQLHSREFANDLGLQAGFGRMEDKRLREGWGNQVQALTAHPYWVVDDFQRSMGHWCEDITFNSTIVFRCPPAFTAQDLSTTVWLNLYIRVPGVGNDVQLRIGPLPISSGIAPPQATYPRPEIWESLPAAATGLEAHHSDELDTVDLPPSYYAVINGYDETPDKA